MRKIIFTSSVLFLALGSLLAQYPLINTETAAYNPQSGFPTIQSTQPNAMTISTSDTLRYFLNKHFYRNSNAGNPTPNTQYFTLLNPYTSSALVISHCGAMFQNASPITITGLEGIVTRRASSPSASVPLKLYLCSLNVANLPVMPPMDSVSTVATAATNGAWIGGNFTTPINISGNFAVLFKNASTVAQDTLGLFINNACTPTSTCPVARRFGESLGVFRINGTFQTTTGSFGTGTDYEFIVAPRVQFNYSAGVQVQTPTICTNSAGSFSNTTTPMNLVENRQFNFNKFAAVWGALSNSLLPTTDSIYNWAFSGSSTGPLTSKHATAIFNVNGNQTASLSVKYNKSRVGGLLPSVEDVATGVLNVSSTNAPTITISGNSLVCAGSPATLTASGNTTFTWTNPPSNNPAIVVTPNTTTAYTVAGDNGSCVAYQTFTVSVVQAPNVQITGPSQACVGSTLLLTASGAGSYTWNSGANTYSNQVSATMVGVQFFTVTGETSPCAPVSIVKTITVNSLPSVSVSAPVSTLCTTATGGSTVQLSGTPAGGQYSGTFINSGGVFSPNAVITATINYSYTDPTTQCANTASTTIGVVSCQGPTGILESTSSTHVSLFPNPTATGKIEISNLQGANTISVYNSLGELIAKETSNSSNLILDISNRANGVYFIKVNNENGSTKTVRAVLQKQ